MVTEIDHEAVITRIHDILKSDTTNIYGPKLIRSMLFGIPNEGRNRYPYCYVVLEENDDEIQDYDNGQVRASFERVIYKLVVVVQEKDMEENEKRLYAFHKAIREKLKANTPLYAPGTTSDAKCKVCRTAKARFGRGVDSSNRLTSAFEMRLIADFDVA